MKFNPFSFFRSKKEELPQPRKQLVHIDNKANKWYVFADPLEMHVDRELELRDAEDFLRMNMTREWLQEWTKTTKELVNKGDIFQLSQMLSGLEIRSEMDFSRRAYVHFCSVFYLINDEPLEGLDPRYVEQKRLLLESNSELRDFFLRDAFMRLHKCEQELSMLFLTYLQKTEKIDKATWNHSTSDLIVATNSTNSA